MYRQKMKTHTCSSKNIANSYHCIVICNCNHKYFTNIKTLCLTVKLYMAVETHPKYQSVVVTLYVTCWRWHLTPLHVSTWVHIADSFLLCLDHREVDVSILTPSGVSHCANPYPITDL